MSAKGVKIEDEQIEIVKNWHEPKAIRDILVFFYFTNFYWHFIQSFSKITRPLTLMLKTRSAIRSSKNLLLPIDVVEVDKIGVSNGGDYEDETVGRSLSENLNKAMLYPTSNAKQVFTQMREAFTKAPILWHFDLECHIRIEIDALDYAIGCKIVNLVNTLD